MNSHSNANVAPQSLRLTLGLTGLLFVLSLVALRFDLVIAAAHGHDVLPGDLRRVVGLSEVFAHGFGLVTISVAIFLLSPELRRKLPRLILCGVLASGAAHLGKLATLRVRPIAYRNRSYQFEFPDSISASWVDVHQQLRESHVEIPYFVQSFPSAHAAMSVGVAVALCWLLPRGKWLFIVLAILACYQRVQSYAHWTSDVFAGAAVGVLAAGLLLQDWGLGKWLGRYERKLIDHEK